MTELEPHTVAVRVSGPQLDGDPFLDALVSHFPESDRGAFAEWHWSWAPDAPEWSGRINIWTSAPNFAPAPPIAGDVTVSLAGRTREDVDLVVDVLESWFQVTSRDLIDPDTHEVCLRLAPRAPAVDHDALP